MKCCLCFLLWGIPASAGVDIRSVLSWTACVFVFCFFLQRKRKAGGALTPGQITGLRFLIQRPLRWCKQICFWFRKSSAVFFFFPSAVTAKLSVHISLLHRVRFTQSSGGITSRLRHSPLPPPPLLGLLLLASCPSGDFSRGVSHALQQGSECSCSFLTVYSCLFESLQPQLTFFTVRAKRRQEEWKKKSMQFIQRHVSFSDTRAILLEPFFFW